MKTGRNLIFTALLGVFCTSQIAFADRLNGRVEKDGENVRLARPGAPATDLNDSLEVRALGGMSGGMALGSPLSGAVDDDLHKGGISASDFALPSQQRPRPQPLRPQVAPLTTSYTTRDRSNDVYFQWLEDFNVSPVPVYHAPGWGGGWAPEDWRYRVRRVSQVSGTLTSQQTQADLMTAIPSYTLPPAQSPGTPAYSRQPTYTPAAPPQPSSQDELQTVVWDGWYKRVARAIYSNWSGMRKVAGTADVQLSVTRNGAISARLISVRSDGPQFIKSLSDAVNRLNGNPVLQFPAETRRNSVSFAATFKTGADNTAGVNASDTSDSEIVRRR